VAALNMGSMNYAKYSPRRKQFVFHFVFSNPFDEIVLLPRADDRRRRAPECEVFDTGHAESLRPLIDMGLLRPPIDVNLVMGVLAHASDPDMLALHGAPVAGGQRVEDDGGVAPDLAPDRGRAGAGGHVRVASRTNFYLPGGAMVSSNGELVAQAAALAPRHRPRAHARRRGPPAPGPEPLTPMPRSLALLAMLVLLFCAPGCAYFNPSSRNPSSASSASIW